MRGVRGVWRAVVGVPSWRGWWWGVAVPAADAVEAGPEADLACHGFAVMSAGLVDLAFTPRNHGPAAVSDATVRLRWSQPLTDRQELPEGCARSGRQAVLCRTGALPAEGAGERIGLRVRVLVVPSEVVVELETVWGGGRWTGIGGTTGSGSSSWTPGTRTTSEVPCSGHHSAVWLNGKQPGG
ncbi:hypothetical protein ABZ568_01910 [Streptomyces olindensis]|uniref:Uncharacterized protein n=1 Tax=Streptomyces olindensis TaxID=358823 RepID=A0ABV2XMI9_9ACTN